MLIQLVVVDVELLGCGGTTVNDAGDPASVTQAAARSGALCVTLLGVEFDLHVDSD
jgi:hypothetical protein